MAPANRETTSPPPNATDAVLKPSEPMPDGARQVQGIDFDDYAGRAMTVDELVGGYANMGFQATAVGEAVRIVNDMVSACILDYAGAGSTLGVEPARGREAHALRP